MNIVNNAITYLKDLLQPMPRGWRIATLVLLASVVVAVVWLFQGRNPSADGYLLGGRPFTATELGTVEAAFAKANLNGAVVEGNRIRVPTGMEAQYLLAMAEENALPADFHDGFARDVSSSGPFMDPKVREEVIKNAKQRELAKIIRSMHNVESAAVHWDERKGPGFSRQSIASASVSVKPVLSHSLDSQDVKKIRHLVAAAIGLKPENVTVADLSPSGLVSIGTESGDFSGGDHKYLSVMRAHQKLIEENVVKALAYIQGVSVSAHVELNPELESNKSTTTFDDKKAGTIDRTDQSTQKTAQSNGAGGRPGLAAQQPGAANLPASLGAAGAATTTDDSTNSTVARKVPAQQTESSKHIGLTPKVVRVSVGVPSSYYEAIWNKRNPVAAGQPTKPPTEADLQQIQDAENVKIQRHVAPLIPSADAVDTVSLVQVSPFFSQPSVAVPEAPFTAAALSWLSQSWTTLATFLVALVALWMLRSVWKSIPAAQREPAFAARPMAQREAPLSAGADQREEKTVPPARVLQRRTGGEGSLREELAQVVQEDPAAAANIIKGWISSAN